MFEIKVAHPKDPETSITLELVGGTLVSWKVKGEEQIFVSSLAKRDGSKAIRGGIPLCFPQFGPWGDGKPQHGFARSSEWSFKGKQTNKNGDVSITMSLEDNAETKKLWKHEFIFEVTFTLALENLTLATSVQNKGTEDFDVTFCVHTYFSVDDIAKVKISGLKGLEYVDKTQDGKRIIESNDLVSISQFTDRVYVNAPDTIKLFTSEEKSISLTKENLRDYVVWNPWKENCEKMSDMDNDGYLKMICVEAAQASERQVVKAGGSWQAKQVFSN